MQSVPAEYPAVFGTADSVHPVARAAQQSSIDAVDLEEGHHQSSGAKHLNAARARDEIVKTAQQEAEELLRASEEEAQKEAQKIRKAAQAKAQKILRAAKKKGDEIVEEAVMKEKEAEAQEVAARVKAAAARVAKAEAAAAALRWEYEQWCNERERMASCIGRRCAGDVCDAMCLAGGERGE
jgi:vacuolar-type H+-ATPase subunit H